MQNYEDAELGTRLLPGVDLTLWMQLGLLALLLVVVGAVALTVL